MEARISGYQLCEGTGTVIFIYTNSSYVLLSIYDTEKKIKAQYLAYGMEGSNAMYVLLEFVSRFC